MVSSVLWFLHNTLINRIFLFRNSFTSRAKISTGSSSYVKSGLSSIVSEETTCDGFDQYLFNIETWKTLWIFSKFEGKAKRYAIESTFSITSCGPMNLGLNFPFFPNLNTFFQGDTFKNTFIADFISNIFSFHVGISFCLSVAIFSLCLIIFTFFLGPLNQVETNHFLFF